MTVSGLRTADYFYELPKELIAQDPLAERSASRLLVLDRETGGVTHRVFSDLTEYLRAGDCLVLNDTKVLPARLNGVKRDSGAAVELLLLKRYSAAVWETLVRPGKKLRAGAVAEFGDGRLCAEIQRVLPDGNRVARFFVPKGAEDRAGAGRADDEIDRTKGVGTGRAGSGADDETIGALLEELGEAPLPPYIHHKLEDRRRYQTVYARYAGSAAAPTAGLHFTKELLQRIEAMGVRIVYVTLHVGLGTFRPVKAADVRDHSMHSEWYEVTAQAADTINRTKAEGGRVICVGTTSCRTLESAADEAGHVRPGAAETSIFIYPGYRFRVMDALITNFHLPESTLLMLVSAFAGRERVLAAYETAVRERYRFYSLGDAMMIV